MGGLLVASTTYADEDRVCSTSSTSRYFTLATATAGDFGRWIDSRSARPHHDDADRGSCVWPGKQSQRASHVAVTRLRSAASSYQSIAAPT